MFIAHCRVWTLSGLRSGLRSTLDTHHRPLRQPSQSTSAEEELSLDITWRITIYGAEISAVEDKSWEFALRLPIETRLTQIPTYPGIAV
ncbi:10295_t:CDS:2 [Paraglomus brasilianum]|uniref:10295_t:CDS:1 n=1 Tax=Paraglomus brasilianum TaxID=144538 RepID=A0A9N9BXL5_9GLOM|nr:10295_t:CDS:2 [Paraglomus brasilianum]